MLVDITDRFEIPEEARAVVNEKTAVVGEYLVNKTAKKVTILICEDGVLAEGIFPNLRVKLIKVDKFDLESFDDPSKQIGLFLTEQGLRILATQNFVDYLEWNSCRTWNFEKTTLDRFLCAYYKGKLQRTYLKQLQWVARRCAFSEDLGILQVELETYKIKTGGEVLGYFSDDTIIVESGRTKYLFVQTWLDYMQYDELQDLYKRAKRARIFKQGEEITCVVILSPGDV